MVLWTKQRNCNQIVEKIRQSIKKSGEWALMVEQIVKKESASQILEIEPTPRIKGQECMGNKRGTSFQLINLNV